MLEIRQKSLAGFTVAIAVLSNCCVLAFAEDKKDKLGFEVWADYYGKYIWRGQNLVDDGVFQPAFSVTYGYLTGTIWGNIELTNINDNSGEITEADYSLDYSSSFPGIDAVAYTIGVINYVFPDTGIDDTTELYAGLSLDWLLSPAVKFYRDVDEAEGTYISFSVGHSIEKIAEIGADASVGIDVGASLGLGNRAYNKFYWGLKENKVNDLALFVSFPLEILEWTVSPGLNYVTLLSDDLRDTDVYDTAGDYFFAGVSLSRSF